MCLWPTSTPYSTLLLEVSILLIPVLRHVFKQRLHTYKQTDPHCTNRHTCQHDSSSFCSIETKPTPAFVPHPPPQEKKKPETKTGYRFLVSKKYFITFTFWGFRKPLTSTKNNKSINQIWEVSIVSILRYHGYKQFPRFLHVNLSDLRKPLTSTKTNSNHLLAIMHPHNKYENYPCFL